MQQTCKHNYLDDSEDERIFEAKVVSDIKNLILRLGKGFCFIGNQYRLEVAGEEFFIDLLFFKSIDKAMGVATYRTSRQVPQNMKKVLPDTAELAKLL